MVINAAFQWKCEPKAEQLLLKILNAYVAKNTMIAELQEELLKKTSTRLFDWLDYVVVNFSVELEIELAESGFVSDQSSLSYRVYHHPRAQLPRLIVNDHKQQLAVGIGVSVESISDFLMVRGLSCQIEGTPFSSFRRSHVNVENGVTLWVIERRGTVNVEPTYHNVSYLEKYLTAKEKWDTRSRSLDDENATMEKTLHIAEEIVHLIGKDVAACLVLEGERHYWESRNIAGQVQKDRQDRLGMGWANHDHHTFRSSRERFSALVRLFEMLGFHCRERFYAGEEAGWGAQVMENPVSRLVLFLDVDLAPHELEVDFAHHPLPALPHLGTIGLWCALHGDSILHAGMHHLEAQFMFDELKQDLANAGLGMMDPFSNFSYLKQAFTAGEIWEVDHKRIEQLHASDKINSKQAEKFKNSGALGSHMENLQRREGYKGFNQKNVSFIIKKTDPRQL